MTATLLTGCGSSEAPASEAAASTADSSTAVATAPAETTADGELAADVQAIVDRGVLRVGVKNAVVGFGFQDTLTSYRSYQNRASGFRRYRLRTGYFHHYR